MANCMNCMVGRFKDFLCSDEICKIFGKKGSVDDFENIVLAKIAYVIKDDDGNIHCSNCGSNECWGNYCMNCGAKMRV